MSTGIENEEAFGCNANPQYGNTFSYNARYMQTRFIQYNVN